MGILFLCDSTLGKLAKWLRILGYDTEWEGSDRNFLERIGQEGRIALTRKRGLAGHSAPGGLIVVRADRIERQIDEVLSALTLQPASGNRMTLCLLCNEKLIAAAKGEVEERVPPYIRQNCPLFRKCPVCGRIYWPGTHLRRVEEYLKKRIPNRPL